MHPNDFNRLLKSVDHASFSADKINRIRIASHNKFSSMQVRTLMDHLKFDSDRVKVACMLYPHVVDRANWHIALDGLSFDSSRHEVMNCSRR